MFEFVDSNETCKQMDVFCWTFRLIILMATAHTTKKITTTNKHTQTQHHRWHQLKFIYVWLLSKKKATNEHENAKMSNTYRYTQPFFLFICRFHVFFRRNSLLNWLFVNSAKNRFGISMEQRKAHTHTKRWLKINKILIEYYLAYLIRQALETFCRSVIILMKCMCAVRRLWWDCCSAN